MMAQAMQAMITGGSLPPNCYVMTLPVQQAQQIFPQLMMATASVGGTMLYAQPPPYYGQLYPPPMAPYAGHHHHQQQQQYPNALVPYSQPHAQAYPQYPNYPAVSYKKSKRGARSQPHPNVYNSGSFDSRMDNLSWSRLFGRPHDRQHSGRANRDSTALHYDSKSLSSKQQGNYSESTSSTSSSSSSGSSTTTTSDETIRRVNLANKQAAGSASSKQQTRGSLPFKYSSEFIPGTGKPRSSHRDVGKHRSDDIFIVKHPQPPPQL